MATSQSLRLTSPDPVYVRSNPDRTRRGTWSRRTSPQLMAYNPRVIGATVKLTADQRSRALYG